MSQPITAPSSAALNTKFAAGIILLTSVLTIFMMLHHPSISSHHAQDMVEEVVQESTISGLIHGVIIMLMMLTFAAFSIYSRQRGLDKLSVLFANICYGVATFSMTGAALISGFIFPGIAQYYVAASADELSQLVALQQLCWQANQALANLGVIATSVAILSWLIDLYKNPLTNWLLAVMGLIIALGSIIGLLSGWLQLNVTGMTTIVIAQGIWNGGLALLLLTRRL